MKPSIILCALLPAVLAIRQLKPNTTYIITAFNLKPEDSNIAIDLSADDNRAVIAYHRHNPDQPNQEWILNQNSDSYWTIKSKLTGAYLAIDGPVQDDSPSFASTTALAWDITLYEPVSSFSGPMGRIRAIGQNPKLSLQLPNTSSLAIRLALSDDGYVFAKELWTFNKPQ